MESKEQRAKSKERVFVKCLKFKRWFYTHHLPFVSRVLDEIYRLVFACDIPSQVQFGNGCQFAHHGLAVVIHRKTALGDRCKLLHSVTIGCRNNEGPPTIGNDVYIGAGACILGDVVIGNNVSIGANAVVLDSIPDGCIAVGVPAQIKKKTKDFIDGFD